MILLAWLLLMTGNPAAPQPAAPAAQGEFVEREHRGEHGSRRYRVYVPSGQRAGTPPPLVLMLHGCTQDAADLARGTRMNALAEAHGVLVVYPEQPAEANPARCWNWFDPAHQRRDAGEPALLADLAEAARAEFGGDPRRVYVAGISAGGAMALVLAAAYPERFAAVGVHSAVPYAAAHDTPSALRAMRGELPDAPELAQRLAAVRAEGTRAPLIVFHGVEDAVVRPANARALLAQWVPAAAPAAACPDGLAADARAGSCRVTGPGWELWLVDGLGHAWSGGAPEGSYTDSRGPDASREMLRFFLEHTLAPPCGA